MNPVSFRATSPYASASATSPKFSGGLFPWLSKDGGKSRVYSDDEFSPEMLDAAERRFQLIKGSSGGPNIITRLIMAFFDLFAPKG